MYSSKRKQDMTSRVIVTVRTNNEAEVGPVWHKNMDDEGWGRLAYREIDYENG